MKLVLAETKYLKESINIISELVNEASVKVSKDGLELTAMDPANVAMVIFKLFSSAFVEYKVEKEDVIGINLDNFKQILRRVKPSDTLTMELEQNKLKVKLKGDSTRTFSLALINIDEKEHKIPDLKFNAKIEMPSGVLIEAVDDVDVVADSVALNVEKGKFVIDAEGKLNTAKVEILEGLKIALSGDKEKVSARYSIEYLKKLVRGSKLSENAIVQLDDEYPLKIDYNVIDKLSLSMILAPRVAND